MPQVDFLPSFQFQMGRGNPYGEGKPFLTQVHQVQWEMLPLVSEGSRACSVSAEEGKGHKTCKGTA